MSRKDEASPQTHLFHYHFEGSEYFIEVPADSEKEARARVRVISSRAHYDGVLVAKIPAKLSWLAKAICLLRNTWRSGDSA